MSFSSTVSEEYANIVDFASTHNNITYAEFDLLTKNRVNLFAIRENFDFDALEEAINRILAALPSMKRIFSKPIIRLKDSDAILPVESVRVVNSKTVTHTVSHSEMWDNVTKEGLRPRALLTVQNKDDYAIYENTVFAKAVDLTLAFVSQNARILRDMLYACRDIRLNLLERDDHIEYFLAIGKLHMAYVRDYDKYVNPARRCLSKLLFIESTLRSRLGSPVYRKCKGSKAKITLKKTNVFRSHKDYRRVYQLMKWYMVSNEGAEPTQNEDACPQSEAYTLFCSMITVFAAGHFGFEFPRTRKIDFNDLKLAGSAKGWRLAISREVCQNVSVLRVTVLKDVPYSAVIIPVVNENEAQGISDVVKNGLEANEFVTAFIDKEESDCVRLSIFDIQSFRKVQQILLRAMVYSDKTRDICPFCMKELTKSGEGDNAYECPSCRTLISSHVCEVTGEEYSATSIKNHQNELLLSKDALTAQKQISCAMHFRNITDIDRKASIICPKCKKVHKNGELKTHKSSTENNLKGDISYV